MSGAKKKSCEFSTKPTAASPWSGDEVAALVRMWGEGHSNREISKEIGRPENAVAIKASRLRLPAKHTAVARMRAVPGKQPDARVRPCLSCRQPFFSEGKFNRICDPCKSGSDGGSDYVVNLGGDY